MVNEQFPKIGISCWEETSCDTTCSKQLHEVKITAYRLENQDDRYELTEHGIVEGIDVFIGEEKCVRYATQRDFPSVSFSTIGESIETVISQTEIMHEMAEFEKHSYAQFFTVFDSSFSGIIKIGADE